MISLLQLYHIDAENTAGQILPKRFNCSSLDPVSNYIYITKSKPKKVWVLFLDDELFCNYFKVLIKDFLDSAAIINKQIKGYFVECVALLLLQN